MNTTLDRTLFFPCVLQAVPVNDYKVYAYFNDGSVRLFDMKPFIRSDTVFAPLADEQVFRNALTVLNDTVAWDLTGKRDTYDCIDIDPETVFDSEACEGDI